MCLDTARPRWNRRIPSSVKDNNSAGRRFTERRLTQIPQPGNFRDQDYWIVSKRGEAQMCEDAKPMGAESDAIFLGWQKTRSGKTFALYNVTAKNHPFRGSTVTETSLHRLNLRVPGTPPLQGSPSDQRDDQRKGQASS